MPCRCSDPRRGFLPRQRWRKRESAVMVRTLKAARKQRQSIYMGNCALPDGCIPEDVKATLSRFTRSIRPLGKIKCYLESGERYSAKTIKQAGEWVETESEPIIYDAEEQGEVDRLEDADEINDRLHIHYIIVSDKIITQHRIRELWTTATGCTSRRKTTVFHEQARSIVAAAKYVTGNVKNKFYSPMFRRGKDIQVTAGSQNFHNGDMRMIYKQIARSCHARADAIWDGDILDHPEEAHYLALAELSQVAKNGSNSALPDADALEAIMWGDQEPQKQLSTNILHNYDNREATNEATSSHPQYAHEPLPAASDPIAVSRCVTVNGV